MYGVKKFIFAQMPPLLAIYARQMYKQKQKKLFCQSTF